MLIFFAALVDEHHDEPAEKESLQSFQGRDVDVKGECDILV